MKGQRLRRRRRGRGCCAYSAARGLASHAPAPLRAPAPATASDSLRAPHVRHRHSGDSARSQPSPSSLPPRCRTGRPCRPQTGGPGGASVGSWEEGTPRPPPQARPPLLFSLLGTSYRCFSEDLRPAPGVDRTVPLWWLLGVPGRDRLEKAQGGRVRKSGGRELFGFVYLGGVRVRDPSLSSAVRALIRACALLVEPR